MKNMIKVLVLAVAMITFNVSTYAQKSERQRMTREQLAEAQAHFIANEMAMDDTTTKQFVELSANSRKIFGHWVPVLKETLPIFRIKKLNRR